MTSLFVSIAIRSCLQKIRICELQLLSRRKYIALPISRKYCSKFSTVQNVQSSESVPQPAPKQVENDIQFVKIGIISQSNPLKCNVSLRTLDNVLEFLLGKGIPGEEITSVFVRFPQLCNYARASWEQTFQILEGNGVASSQIIKMLASSPQILQKDSKLLEEVIMCLQEHGFADKQLSHLITRVPLLLVTRPSFIASQIAFLMTIFTRSDIFKLSSKCPQVLLDDMDVTEEKVRYIVHEIGVDQKQILASHALSHSLTYIKLRHQLMLRTGHYKKPHPKRKDNNPKLSFITDTVTGDLLKTIGISLEEYEMFEKMFEVELKRSSDSSDTENSD